MVQYVGRLYPQVPSAIKDPSALFTDELIDDVNQFDRAAVERMAQTLTL
jgi:hypothetical protein